MKETLKQVQEERDRLKAGVEDMAEYSAFPGTKHDAAHILDYSVPLKRSVPKRN